MIFFRLPAGSCDSCVKLWECGEGFRNLKQLFSVPMVRYSQTDRCIELGSVYKYAPQALPFPVQHFPSPYRSIHFSDVSKANGQETHFRLDHVTQNAMAARNDEA